MDFTKVFFLACQTGVLWDIRNALAAGVDPNGVDRGGHPALHLAARSGRLEAVKLLLDAGADIDAVNAKQQTALEVMIERRQMPTAQFLLVKGADARWPCVDGSPLLHRVAQWGEPILVPGLVRNGADVDETDQHGLTALQYAVRGSHVAVVKALLMCGANADVLAAEPLSGEVRAVVMGWRAKQMLE